MQCPQCGAVLANDAKFCPVCGNSVAPTPGMSSVPPQPGQTVADSFQLPPLQSDSAYTAAPASRPKRSALRIVLVCALAMALVLAGGGGSWLLFGAPLAARLDEAERDVAERDDEIEGLKEKFEKAELKAQGSDGHDSKGAADGAADASDLGGDSSATGLKFETDGDSGGYIGTWTGELTKTESDTDGRCYAGRDNPMSLNIKSVEGNGRMKLDASLLYHDHDDGLKSDVDATEGDSFDTYTDITSTMEEDGSFSFTITKGAGRDTGSLEITCSFDKAGGVTQQRLTVIVKSDPIDDHHHVTDTYVLTKSV